MKITELNKTILAGGTVLTGKFMGCTVEKTRSGEKEYEVTKVAGPVRNIELKKFAPKGSPLGTLKARFNFPFGSPVAIVGFSADVRDGYLQTECTDVVLIEP